MFKATVCAHTCVCMCAQEVSDYLICKKIEDVNASSHMSACAVWCVCAPLYMFNYFMHGGFARTNYPCGFHYFFVLL